jgi:luciferase family oxidoreductase group 1
VLRLGVLDQSPVLEGAPPAQALRNSLDLAAHCDALGFTRYWVSEHHGGVLVAGTSPEVLIGPIAAATQRIRVGSGGVMLPHYSPLKVAESFSLLAGLYPERIDLAVGRAAGTDAMTAYALQRDRRAGMPDDFPQQLAELLAYLNDDFPEGHAFARLPKSLPGLPEAPEPWLLGSSPQSAIWAGELGLPYAFADFINPHGAAIARDYRTRFTPSERHRDPYTAVGLSVIAAETDEEAQRLAASQKMSFELLTRGRLIPVPPPDKAIRFLEGEGLAAAAAGHRRRRLIVGRPDVVRAQIEQVADEYRADEVIVVTITHDHEARRRSYELVAEAFELPGSATTTSSSPAIRT